MGNELDHIVLVDIGGHGIGDASMAPDRDVVSPALSEMNGLISCSLLNAPEGDVGPVFEDDQRDGVTVPFVDEVRGLSISDVGNPPAHEANLSALKLRGLHGEIDLAAEPTSDVVAIWTGDFDGKAPSVTLCDVVDHLSPLTQRRRKFGLEPLGEQERGDDGRGDRCEQANSWQQLLDAVGALGSIERDQDLFGESWRCGRPSDGLLELLFEPAFKSDGSTAGLALRQMSFELQDLLGLELLIDEGMDAPLHVPAIHDTFLLR